MTELLPCGITQILSNHSDYTKTLAKTRIALYGIPPRRGVVCRSPITAIGFGCRHTSERIHQRYCQTARQPCAVEFAFWNFIVYAFWHAKQSIKFILRLSLVYITKKKNQVEKRISQKKARRIVGTMAGLKPSVALDLSVLDNFRVLGDSP